MLPQQDAWVQSPVRELISCEPCGSAKKNKTKQNKTEINVTKKKRLEAIKGVGIKSIFTSEPVLGSILPALLTTLYKIAGTLWGEKLERRK